MKLYDLLLYFQPSALFRLFVKKRVFRVSKTSKVIDCAQSLTKDDSGRAIIRVHPSLIKSPRNVKGMFISDSLIKLYNGENGLVYIGQVKGAGPSYEWLRNNSRAIAIDYYARSALAIGPKNIVNIQLGAANRLDEEYFYSHFETDRGARKSHKTAWAHFRMGAYLAIWLPLVQPIIQRWIMG